MVIGTHISITTLNVNGLNAPTKRHRLAEWIQKQDPYICCLQETHFRPRDTYRLKVRAWKKIFYANGNQKKAGVAILISDKIDFKIKTITRDKDGHYINDQGINPRRYNNCKYLCTQHRNTSTHKASANSHKRGNRQEHINIIGDFNTPLSPMDRSSNTKINKETQALNDTLNKMDLTGIYRTFHPRATKYTFFSSAHGIFSRRDHILGHKSSLDKFKKIEIVSSIFSNDNTMRQDINYRGKKI